MERDAQRPLRFDVKVGHSFAYALQRYGSPLNPRLTFSKVMGRCRYAVCHVTYRFKGRHEVQMVKMISSSQVFKEVSCAVISGDRLQQPRFCIQLSLVFSVISAGAAAHTRTDKGAEM